MKRRRTLCGSCYRFISVSGIEGGFNNQTGVIKDHMHGAGFCPGSGQRVELASTTAPDAAGTAPGASTQGH